MIYRIFSSKDTFITNHKRSSTPQTGSNFGSSEILHLFKRIDAAGTASLGRILTSFDLAGMSALTASGEAPAAGVRFYLKMFDAQHCGPLPSSYDVEVQGLSQDWDEGRGHDVDNFSDKGFANWDKAKSNVFWTTPGASGSGVISSFHFDQGHENLEVDVSDIVQSWLDGTSTNNGFLVRISSSLESNGLEYYTKMFHGRETSFKDKRPVLEARWDDSVKDDRNNFFFDVSGSLFMHHVVRGQRQNIPEIGTGSIGVRVVDASGTIAIVTGSYAGRPGTYSASFLVPTGSYSGSLFHDIWFDLSSPSRWFVTGAFGIGDSLNVTDISPKKYFVNIPGLRDSYEDSEVVRMGLFVRPIDYNPARVLTASLDSHGTVITKGYYRITNDRTDEVVVPWGTGSTEFTRLSYDENGNHFTVHMSSLAPGNIYRISFLFDVDGQRQYILDAGLKFRVT